MKTGKGMEEKKKTVFADLGPGSLGIAGTAAGESESGEGRE